MLMRMKSTTGEKFSVDVYVQEVVLKKTGTTLEKDSSISLAIERGKKFVHSTEKEPKMTSTGDSIIEFNENLSLDATLFHDAKSKYQEKVGKLLVRKKKKGLMSSHVNIGSITLPLHTLVYEDQPFEKTYLLENCTYPGSQIRVAIAMRSLDDNTSTHRKSDAMMLSSQHSSTSSPAPSVGSTYHDQGHPPPVPPRPTSTTTHSQNHNGSASNFDSHVSNGDPFAATTEFERSRGLTQTSETAKSDIFNSAVDFGATAADFDPFAESFGAETVGQAEAGDTWAETSFTNDWPSPSPTPLQAHTPVSSPQKKSPAADHHDAELPTIAPPPLPVSLPPLSPAVTKPHTITANSHDQHPAVAAPDHNDIDFVKQVVVVQEQKLQQAAQYVSFQELQITSLNEEIEALKAQLSSADSSSLPPSELEKMKQMESVILIQEGKLHNAEDFVKFQEDEIRRLNEEVTQLKATVETIQAQSKQQPSRDANSNNGTSAPPVDAAEESSLKVKLEEAAEYISYQEEKLAELEAQVEELQQQLASAASGDAAPQSIHVATAAANDDYQQQAEMLAKAREYIDYQAAELEELKGENDKLKVAVAALTAAAASNAQTAMGDLKKSYEEKIANLVESNASSEQKLAQAKEYIDFQTEQQATTADEMAELTAKVAALEQKLAAEAASATTVRAGSTHNEEELQQKIQQAAEYIQYQEEELASKATELEALTAEVAKLTASIAKLEDTHRNELDTLKQAHDKKPVTVDNSSQIAAAAEAAAAEKEAMLDKIADMEQKLVQAKEYIQFQTEQQATTADEMAELTAKLAALEQKLAVEAASATTVSTNDEEELQQKIQQAAEYIQYQEEELANKATELEALTAEVAKLTASIAKLEDTHRNELDDLKKAQVVVQEKQPVVVDNSNQIAAAAEAAAAEKKALLDKIAEMEQKLQQAGDYIQFQDEQSASKEEELEEERKGFEEERKKLEKAYHDLEMQINGLQHDLSTHQSQSAKQSADNLSESQVKILDMEQKMKQAADYIKFQDEQLAGKDEDLQELREECDAEKAQLEQKLHTLHEEHETFKSAQAKEYAELADKVKDMEEKLQQAADYIAYQTEEVATSQQQLKDLEAKYSAETATLRSQVEEVQKLLADKDAKLSTTEAQLRTLQVAYEDEKKTSAEKLQQAADYIQYQDEQNASKDDQIEALEISMEKLKQDLKTVQSGADNTASKFQELETKLQQAAEFISYQKEQLAEAEERETTLQTENATELAAIKAVQAEQVTQLEAFIAQKEDENADLLMQLREMQTSTVSKAEKSDLESKLDQAKEFIGYQEEQIKDQHEEIEQLTAKVEALTKSMTQSQTQSQAATESITNAMKVEMQNHKNDVQRLTEELRKQEELFKNSSAANSELKDSKMKLDQASEYIEYQTSLINDLEAEVKSMKQEHEVKLASYQEQLAAVSEELEHMHDTSDKKDKLISQLKAETERLKSGNKATTTTMSSSVPVVAPASSAPDFDEAAYAAQLKQSQEEIKMYQQLAGGIAEKLLSLLPEKIRTKVASQMRKSTSVKDSGQQIASLIDSISAYLLEASKQQSSSTMSDSDRDKLKQLEDDSKAVASRMSELELKYRDKDQECEKIVKELISTKMDLANALNDKDTERKRMFDLRKQLRSVQQQQQQY